MLEKDGEEHLDLSWEKWRRITYSQGGGCHYTIKSGKTDCIVHVLRWNCLLKEGIEGKMEERTKVTGRRGRRRKELMDELKERRGYWKLKEKALDRTLWQTCFERGYGSVVSQSTEWLKQMYKKVTYTEGVLWTQISTFGEMDLYPILSGRELWPLKPNNYFDLVTWTVLYIILFKT